MGLKTCSGQIRNDSAQFQMERRTISRRRSFSLDHAERFIAIYDARACLLFCSVNLLFSDVLHCDFIDSFLICLAVMVVIGS